MFCCRSVAKGSIRGHAWRWFCCLFPITAWLLATRPVVAGMPSALPEDFETVFRLRDLPHQRFQAISFFLLGVVISTWGVQGLWNFLARDFPRLPRLTFSKALAIVVLWGLLFVVVLTMISGARELMTPGAWRKDGLTYSLAEDPDTFTGSSPNQRAPSQERRAASIQQTGAGP